MLVLDLAHALLREQRLRNSMPMTGATHFALRQLLCGGRSKSKSATALLANGCYCCGTHNAAFGLARSTGVPHQQYVLFPIVMHNGL